MFTLSASTIPVLSMLDLSTLSITVGFIMYIHGLSTLLISVGLLVPDLSTLLALARLVLPIF